MTRREILSWLGASTAVPLALVSRTSAAIEPIAGRNRFRRDSEVDKCLQQVADKLLSEVEAQLILGRLVTRHLEEGQMLKAGDTINIPVLSMQIRAFDNIPVRLGWYEASAYVPFDIVDRPTEAGVCLQPVASALAEKMESLLWEQRRQYDVHTRIQAPWEQPKLVFDCVEAALFRGGVRAVEHRSLIVDPVTFNTNRPQGHPVCGYSAVHDAKPYYYRGGIGVYPSRLPAMSASVGENGYTEIEHLAFAKGSLALLACVPPEYQIMSSEFVVFSAVATANDLALRLVGIPYKNTWTLHADILCGAAVLCPAQGLQLVV